MGSLLAEEIGYVLLTANNEVLLLVYASRLCLRNLQKADQMHMNKIELGILVSVFCGVFVFVGFFPPLTNF